MYTIILIYNHTCGKHVVNEPKSVSKTPKFGTIYPDLRNPKSTFYSVNMYGNILLWPNLTFKNIALVCLDNLVIRNYHKIKLSYQHEFG